jgi:hypothetical protein
MKKNIAIITASVGLAATTFGQGIVLFNNSGGTKVSINSVVGGAATGTTAATADAYYYELFASTTQTSVNGSTAAVIPTATSAGTYAFDATGWAAEAAGASTASAGRFNSTAVDGSGNTILATVSGGVSTTVYTVLGWSANIGTSYQSVEAFLTGSGPTSGWVGESVVSGFNPAGILGSTPAPALFGGGSPYIGGFTLGYYSVPEPTSIALGVMGGLSLLALSRKKA